MVSSWGSFQVRMTALWEAAAARPVGSAGIGGAGVSARTQSDRGLVPAALIAWTR